MGLHEELHLILTRRPIFEAPGEENYFRCIPLVKRQSWVFVPYFQVFAVEWKKWGLGRFTNPLLTG